MAFREAFNGAPGPSFLEIPRDVLDCKVDLAKAVDPGRRHVSRVDEEHRRSARHREAGRHPREREAPVRAARHTRSGRCRGGRRGDRVRRQLNIPAYMNGAGRGTLAPDDPLNFHQTRALRLRQGRHDRDRRDAVRLPHGLRQERASRPTVVQIDMSYARSARTATSRSGSSATSARSCPRRPQATSGRVDNGARRREEWVASCAPRRQRRSRRACPRLLTDANPIHPLRLAHEIDQFLTENSIFIGDGGDVVTFSGDVVQPKGPGHWMDPGPLGTLGVGTGFAMAAKLAQSGSGGRRLFGDGAFALTGWDFADRRAVRAALHRDHRQQLVHEPDSLRPDRRSTARSAATSGITSATSTSSSSPEMLGVHGEAVREAKDNRAGARRARESGKCALINVWIDPNAYAPGTENQTMYK